MTGIEIEGKNLTEEQFKEMVQQVVNSRKWYDSFMGTCIGLGAMSAGILFGLSFLYSGNTQPRNQQIYQADINYNGVPDKFYVIDGKIAIVELDGRTFSKSLDDKVLND